MNAPHALARAVFVFAVTVAFVPALLAQTKALEVKDASSDPLLYLDTAGGFVVRGTFDSSLLTATPAAGAGIRVMWYPAFGAFRAGGVVGGTPRIPGESNTLTTLWDQDYLGWYSTAFGLDTQARGDYTLAVGLGSFASGKAAVAMGEGTTASGTSSVALGYRAHTNSRQGSFVFADRSSDDAFRATINSGAFWRTTGGFRIFTSSDLSNGVTIHAGTSTSNWNQTNAVISTSTGAYLHTNGTWTNSSDSTRKHLFEPVSGEDVLERLRTLPIKHWTYRTEPDSVRHLGPTAQDFHAAFGLGDDEKVIGTVDADGVALAATQALEARSRELDARFEALRADNAVLRARLDALEAVPIPFSAGASTLALLVLAAGGVAFAARRRSGRPTHA